jgi:acyl carrier protein
LIAFYVFVKNDEKQQKRKIEEAFEGRKHLSEKEFFEKYFESQGISEKVVTGVRKVLEVQLGADLSRLSASDDFSNNIGFFFELDSMAGVEIVCALEEEFSIKITDEEAENARTIQDIVNLVWHKVQHA